MIKRMTKNFTLYMSDALEVLCARCRKSGKFVKLSIAKNELVEAGKYSCMSALFICIMSVLNALFFMSNSFDLKQIILFNIVGAISILFTFLLSVLDETN